MDNRQIEIELNNAWWGHGDKEYRDTLLSVKLMGYKVFRDSNGNHKVQKNENFSIEDTFFSTLFGGAFKK